MLNPTLEPLNMAADHVVGLDWSADGKLLCATPVTGPISILDPTDGRRVAHIAEHGLGNGSARFHPFEQALATCGCDGAVRLYAPPWTEPFAVARPGKAWIERVRWSPDGTHLATAAGKRVIVFDNSLRIVQEFGDHKTSVTDITWNPRVPEEFASVCGGGALMWRLGETTPFARFDWGGASMLVLWSPDGRWVVTGDQTPSVHLYDFTRDCPLHIQGFATKVKALAFSADARSLATGGGQLVTVWNCTGKAGPEGTMPAQLEAHTGDVIVLSYDRRSDRLLSGGSDGLVCIFEPGEPMRPQLIQRCASGISAAAWNALGTAAAVGTQTGEVAILRFG